METPGKLPAETQEHSHEIARRIPVDSWESPVGLLRITSRSPGKLLRMKVSGELLASLLGMSKESAGSSILGSSQETLRRLQGNKKCTTF